MASSADRSKSSRVRCVIMTTGVGSPSCPGCPKSGQIGRFALLDHAFERDALLGHAGCDGCDGSGPVVNGKANVKAAFIGAHFGRARSFKLRHGQDKGRAPMSARDVDDVARHRRGCGPRAGAGPGEDDQLTKSPSMATQFKTPSMLASALDFGIMVGETRASIPPVLAATAKSLMR